MRKCSIWIILGLFALIASALAEAGVSISGSLPATTANGGAYVPAAGDTVNVSKNGGAATPYTVTGAQASAGAFTFTDSTSSNCAKDSWSATYTSIASGLTSAPTAAVSTTIDGVGCAVKFAPGLTVK